MKSLLGLLAVAGLLGAAANAVSPRGLSWTHPLGRGLAAEVADAGLTPVFLRDLDRLLKDPSVLILDVRSREDYDTGHLPRAVWTAADAPVPAESRPILVYCANEFCESSLRLGERLRKAGFRNVAVFVDGYDEWWNARGVNED